MTMIQPTVTMTVGGSPVDLTARLRLDSGITITRGRADQLVQMQAGACTFTLDNTDGALSAYITSGVRYPVQIGSDLGGVRFTGFVDVWVTQWPGGGREEQTVQVTCADLWADLERQGSQSLPWLTINASGPLAFYPLTEGISSDPRAFDASANHEPDLLPYQLGNAGVISWGQGTQAPLDSSRMARFDPSSTTVGWYVQQSAPLNLTTLSNGTDGLPRNAPWTVHAVINTTQTTGGVLFAVVGRAQMIPPSMTTPWSGALAASLTPTGNGIRIWYPDRSSGGTSYIDTVNTVVQSGTAVPITVAYDGDSTFTLWIKEAKTTLAIPGGVTGIGGTVYLAGAGFRDYRDPAAYGSNLALLSGALGNLSIWSRVLADAEVTSVVRSELYGITAGNVLTIQRWLGWYSNTSPDTTTITSPPNSIDASSTPGATWKTSGTSSIATLLTEAEQTEGGLAYVDRTGAVQFLARNTTRALPSLTIDAELVDPTASITTDWRLAVESCTASSTSGESYAYDIGSGTGTTTSLVSLSTDTMQVRAAAQSTVNSNQLTTKMPTLGLDLATLDPATQAAAAALDIGSPVTLQRIPTRPASDPYRVQGYQEAISHTDWSLSLNITSTGPGSGDDILVWDVNAWDAGHRWAW